MITISEDAYAVLNALIALEPAHHKPVGLGILGTGENIRVDLIYHFLGQPFKLLFPDNHLDAGILMDAKIANQNGSIVIENGTFAYHAE